MTSSEHLNDRSSASASAGVLDVDLSAIRANYRLLQARLAGARCAGVVKADAYGLGAAYVAPVLHAEGCRDFFVAHLDEALTLRPLLPADSTLYVLNGLAGDAVRECALSGVVPVLNSADQLAAWRAEAGRLGRVLPAVVQIDTGMSRLGLAPRDVEALARDGLAFAGLDIRFLMSHLACADEPAHPANAEQLAAFRAGHAALAAHPAFARAGRCLANSSGIFLGRDYHFDMARPGAALYGINPQPGSGNPMQAVVRLSARVIQTRAIPQGAHVGYGYTFEAPTPARVATLAVGYADGWLRSLSGRGAAWLDGHRLPILGRVSMDSVCVDISALPEGLVGTDTRVELIGDRQGVDDVATAAGTIGYEILTSLGHRYRRIYRGAALPS
ncbi:MAG: alanine racemase [Pseudochelatococcus sp.]|jgi:alanine racemase|uniref:alanine racemase n=1 Tax=Pseudochelatococcus sp. TaxID=2020869 RepID=UPI003D939A9A